MVEPGNELANSTAFLKEPGPESLVFVTVLPQIAFEATLNVTL